jgi:hypothetical protein
MEPGKIFTGYVKRDLPKNAAESRTIPFILSTGTRDRHHTVFNQNNWKLDNYRRNPIVTYAHGGESLMKGPDPDYVIGKSTRIEVINKQLEADAHFESAETNLLAEKVFRKVILGFLRAASVQIMEVGRGRYGSGKEAKGAENETYYFEGQELLEWGVVNIPSNPDAVAKRKLVSGTARAGLVYIMRELGRDFSVSQIENFTVGEVLTLLGGKDLGIKEKNPSKVFKMLQDKSAKKDLNQIIELQQANLRMLKKKAENERIEAEQNFVMKKIWYQNYD